jgi:hypothetical protein
MSLGREQRNHEESRSRKSSLQNDLRVMHYRERKLDDKEAAT